MQRAFALVCLPSVFALFAPACAPDTCGGLSRSDDENAPEIRAFFVLPEEKQIPGDPWTVLFGIDFVDTNGDLGTEGRAEFYINTKGDAVTQSLDTAFRQSGLAADADEGAFWVTLRFAESTVDDGRKVRLAAQLVDGAKLRSNCYTLDLQFAVYLAASLERAAPTWSVASTRCRRKGRS